MNQGTQPRAHGWIKLLAVLLVIVGVLNVIDGIVAIAGDERYNLDALLFADLTTWGILYAIVGVAAIVAGVKLMSMKSSGMIIAATVASISGIAHFLSIGLYPIWSVTVMIINFFILFGLLTHSDEFTG